jgi:hypothetical protein
MKKRLFKIIFRSLFLFMFFAGGFVALMLNPQLLYAKKTSYKQATVYYQHLYPASFNYSLDQALLLVKKSELYDSSFRYHIFLNDGTSVSPILKKLLGDAFAWGYYNNVVLSGTMDATNQFIQLNGGQRHLARTLAHEMIHDLQAHRFGLFHSRPLKNVPLWKWEGYPEYIAYRSSAKDEKKILLDNIGRLVNLRENSWSPVEIDIDEGKSFAGLDYFRWWLMIKYLVDIKHMSYKCILEEDIKYDAVLAGMRSWYNDQLIMNNLKRCPIINY